MEFEIGEVVGVMSRPRDMMTKRRAVIVGIVKKPVFREDRILKIMEFGHSRISYQLSDRLFKVEATDAE